MIRQEHDTRTVAEKAQVAFRDVALSVVERAKQTHTPIIIHANDRIQTLTPEEFEQIAAEQGNDREKKD